MDVTIGVHIILDRCCDLSASTSWLSYYCLKSCNLQTYILYIMRTVFYTAVQEIILAPVCFLVDVAFNPVDVHKVYILTLPGLNVQVMC